MTHEFKSLIVKALQWQQQDIKMVLATVVALDGSSYRRPGVRMLINDHDQWVGAVSGGCVEKEVHYQAQSVMQSNKPKMMRYDGSLRLGCEGVIYILLEPFFIESAFAKAFTTALIKRTTFKCTSYFDKEASIEAKIEMGSIVTMNGQSFSLHPEASIFKGLTSFTQEFPPIFQLYIFGAEHDAVALSSMANNLGWEVHIIAPPDEQKTIEYFHGAASLSTPGYTQVETAHMDENTAIMLMTHSFNKDVQYLMALKDVSVAYFGLLGPQHRRERLFEQLLNQDPAVDPAFLEMMYGPAGINIGAESASEIAISIIAEILSVIRHKKPISLREKSGSIHA